MALHTRLLKYTTVFLLLAGLIWLTAWQQHPARKKVLVFSKTKGWHHTSIPNGIAAIQKLGQENGFEVDTTTDATWFNDNTLKKYAAVIFLNTTGDVLDNEQQTAFEHYIHHGGGFVGVHSATDTEYEWPWYGKLVGAYFLDHPGIHDHFPGIQEATLEVMDNKFIATKHLPKEWKRKDEWYNFKDVNPDIHVLMKLDENSYQGGRMNGNHPIAWYHNYEGGRSFYTALGHTEDSYTEPLFLKHLLGGIEYAMGK